MVEHTVDQFHRIRPNKFLHRQCVFIQAGSGGVGTFAIQLAKHLGEITKLIDDGIIKPVVDKFFPFESTNEAMVYVEKGRTKGKVVVKLSANVAE